MSFAALQALLAKARSGPLTGLPYAETLGVEYRVEGEQVTLSLPFRKPLVGSPAPPRLHGGAVAGLMELASIAQLVHALREEPEPPAIKPVNVTVDYLRAGQTETTFAAAHVVRMGRRMVNLRVEAWQSDRDRPIAGAHMNTMLAR